MKENENWNVEKRMSGERYFTEYLCSHGNFQYIKKEKKKVNMNQDVQGSLKCWSEVNNTNMNPYVKNTYTQI